MPFNIGGYIYNSQNANIQTYNNIIKPGLFLNLDAASIESYPGSGTTWYDLSGNNRHGTLTNSPGFTSTAGGALTFNASNTYVTLGNLGTIGNYQTIEIWFYSTSVTNYLNMCDMNYATYGGTGNTGPRLEQSSAASLNSGWVWSGNTSNNSLYQGQTTAYTLYANTWYNAVYVNNNGTVNTYLNNTLITSNQSSTYGFVTTYADANIGRGFSLAGNRYFGGYISIFRIYNIALSTSQISENYNIQKGRFGL